MAIQVLTTCGGVDAFELNRYLFPHVLDLLEQKKGYTLHVNDMMFAGRLLTNQGHRQTAAVLFDMALDNMKAAANQSEEGGVIAILSWLAAAYKAGGRWIEAEKLEVDVLGQRTRILGAEHPETILAAANLASTYRDQRRWEEAEKLDVLEQRMRILGPEHSHTIGAVANLAATYADQGRLEEAEKLQMEVLDQRTRIMGVAHPHTILAAGYLAGTYTDQGKREDAAFILEPAVQLGLKVMGQEHPHTQLRVRHLASLYEKLGKEMDAQEMKDLLLS